jgi:hypothetical protein
MQDVIVNYNDINPLNDYKVHAQEQTATAHAAISTVPRVDSTHLAPQPAPILATPHVQTPTRILLAIPTAKYVEVDTFKSMWDLRVPNNCELEFQYFFGYNIQQIRNLQASWMLNNAYDYVLHVDSDMKFPAHTLEQLLSIQTDRIGITSGIYIQRHDHDKVCEVYVSDSHTGGHKHLPAHALTPHRVLEVEAVGFGCCLVHRKVYEQVQNPWFEYKNDLDFRNVISEDVDFCMKAKQAGFQTAVHTGLHYGHIHKTVLVP